jgi:hypothetical protein
MNLGLVSRVVGKYGADDLYCEVCGSKLTDFKKNVVKYNTKTGKPEIIEMYKECTRCFSIEKIQRFFRQCNDKITLYDTDVPKAL